MQVKDEPPNVASRGPLTTNTADFEFLYILF